MSCRIADSSVKSGEDGKRDRIFSGFWDVYLFCLAIKGAGFATFWHFGLVNGFREFAIIFGVMTVGYSMLALCLAELVSVVAFPGGYYGYARCTVHPFFGYIVGCSSLIEAVFITSVSVFRISQSITTVAGTDKGLEPVWWILLHGFSFIIHRLDTKLYGYIMIALAALSMFIYLVFIVGSIPVLDFARYSNIPHSEINLFRSNWLEIYAHPGIFYYGTELIVVASSEVRDAKRIVPRAMLCGYATMFFLAVGVVLAAVSQWPGIDDAFFDTVFPLSFGFKTMFSLSSVSAGAAYAIPLYLTTLLAYVFLSGRMITNLAKSGFLPTVLQTRATDKSAATLPSMVFCAVLAVAMQCVAFTQYAGVTFHADMHAGFFVHVCMFVCYIVFQYRYKHLERTFKSPFGIPGALIGLVLFALAFVSVVVSSQAYIATYVYVTTMLLFIGYYLVRGKSQQQFSVAEQEDFLKVYIINMNARKRRRLSSASTMGALWSQFYSGSSRATIYPGASFMAIDSANNPPVPDDIDTLFLPPAKQRPESPLATYTHHSISADRHESTCAPVPGEESNTVGL